MLIYGIGALVLVIALFYGVRASQTRDRKNDKVTDAAVRAQYEDGENYDPEQFKQKLK